MVPALLLVLALALPRLAASAAALLGAAVAGCNELRAAASPTTTVDQPFAIVVRHLQAADGATALDLGGPAAAPCLDHRGIAVFVAAPAIDLGSPAAAPTLDLPTTTAAAAPTLVLSVPAAPAVPTLDFPAVPALDLANAATAAITLDLDMDMAALNGPSLTSWATDPLVYAAKLVRTVSPADVAGLTLDPDALDPESLA
jgi:hypothetical protein